MFWHKTKPAPCGETMLDGAAIAAVWPCAGLMAPMFIPEIDTTDSVSPTVDEPPGHG